MFLVEVFDVSTDLCVKKIELPKSVTIKKLRSAMGGYVGDRTIGNFLPIFEEHQQFFCQFVGNMNYDKYDYYLNLLDFEDEGSPFAEAY